MKMTTKWMLALALGVGSSSVAFAKEDAATALSKQTPEVQATAAKALNGKKIEEFDEEVLDGKLVYEIGWKEGEVDHAALIKYKGKLLQTEADMAVDKLPAAVTAAIKKAQPDGKVSEAALATPATGDEFYAIDVKTGDVKHVLNIKADGTLLADLIEKSMNAKAPEAPEAPATAK